GATLSWDHVLFGHPACHHIAYTLVSGDTVVDLFDEREVVARWLDDFALVPMDRTRVVRSALAVARHMLTTKPGWLLTGGAGAGPDRERMASGVAPPWTSRPATASAAPAMAKRRSAPPRARARRSPCTDSGSPISAHRTPNTGTTASTPSVKPATAASLWTT